MPEQLKYMYNPAFFESLCPVLQKTIPRFECRRFIYRVFDNQWPELELKQRVRHIATVLHDFLPANFEESAAILIKLARALRQSNVREQSFATIFLPDYIELYGLDHPEVSLAALEEITKLVSAEFAVRPFLVRYPGQTLKQMQQWAAHNEANVRRLASEGCRPRLPWAMALPNFKKDPSPILPILEKLKRDPSEYVRRSVANNLNDIAKDHPDLILKLAKQWRGHHEHTDWIIKHGCRTLLKKGHEHALALHGFNPDAKASVRKLTVSSAVRIGDYLEFGFDFVSREQRNTDFRLEYAIDFVTLSGKISRKVFKITEGVFEPQVPVAIKRRQSFKDFTTRKHFAGKHRISFLVNGKKTASAEFMVR